MAKQSVAELIDFIRTRMRMSHIYQPVVSQSLLDSGNVATVRQLTLDLLSSDEARIRYYEDRIMKMPTPVLSSHRNPFPTGSDQKARRSDRWT